MNKRVLIIDDDEKLNSLLSDYLNKFGYSVRSYTTPMKGIRAVERDKPDIIILDIMLPEMDGFEVLKEIRKGSSIPVIMLTARGEVSDRIVGLELGADDYMPKPFEPRELVARIQSVLRRLGPANGSASILQIKNLKINSSDQTVKSDHGDLEFTTLEFTALELLAKNSGRIFTRDEIMDSTRGIEWDSFDRSVDVLMSRIRTKLGDDARHPRYIKTVRGRGYMFIREDRHDT